jgi:acetylglutamate kinase
MGKAAILTEALPYIRRFAGTTVVVKYGGSAMDDSSFAKSFARDVALLSQVGVRVVVVHGGGPQITAAMKKEGIAPTWVDGLRVTTRRTMELVRRVLGGEVNGEITRMLEASGARAVGLNGVDAGMLRCRQLDGRLGRVGELVEVNPALLKGLLEAGMVPAVAPLGLGLDGEVYNLNADTVAGALAAALKAQKLVFLTDVEGVYRNAEDSSSLISKMTLSELAFIVDRFKGGMLPKLRAVVAAMRDGVSQAHILDGRVQHALLLEMFTPEGIGTMIIQQEGESQ